MWNKYRFLFSSVFRRSQLLLGNLAVILLAVCLPLSASADTISFKPTFGVQDSNFLSIAGSFTNSLEQQYTYGGTYNPLILGCETSHSWTRAIASVRWNFGKTLPAGTEITIQCAGWHNRSYSLNGKSMSVALTAPTTQANWQTFLAERTVLPFNNGDNYVQTSNGVYHGYLCTGKYVLPADTSYIYLVWDITLNGTRNGGTYVGISLSSVSYQGKPVSPAESDVYGTPESGTLDDTSTAIGDVDSAESALISGGDSAISGAFDSLASSVNSLNSFVSGFVFVQRLCSSLVSSLPFLNVLIPISVGLGLFAMLIGIIGSVVSRSKGGGKDDSSG